MQQISAQQRFANLQIVGASVRDSVEQSGDVAWGESGLELVQMQIEIALACPGDLNRRIRRDRVRVGWWEFSARVVQSFAL